MRLYSELAGWFHLLTAPEDCAEEAAEVVRLAEAAVDGEAATLLELGSGGAVFLPDCTRETLTQETRHGGHDGEGRALRYLEWTRDPDPADSWYEVDYAVLLRDGSEPARVVHDHHVEGVFARDEWLAWLRETGFEVRAERIAADDAPDRTAFVARRPR